MARSQRRVEAFTHEQRTPNQPTEETRSSDDPVPILTSPPSDRGPREPQLWWRSKEPENGWVQSAPRLYTQERIVPENYVKAMLKGGKPDEGDLFYDKFNGLDPQSAWEPYEHQARWANRLIRGESSQIMASLLEHEDMAGKVQMVYYDPPYGIGYDSNFQQLTGKPGARKGMQADVETVKAFRDRYQDNLHSYMDSLHRNLVLVRELLAEGGHCFIQMGSENVHEVAMVAQHVFGKENRMGMITYTSRKPIGEAGLPEGSSYIIWFTNNRAEGLKTFNRLFDHKGERKAKTKPLSSIGERKGRAYTVEFEGRRFRPSGGRSWPVSEDGMKRLVELGRIKAGGKSLSVKMEAEETPGPEVGNNWPELMKAARRKYAVQTATKTVERCMLMTTKPGDLVLDITCGSGTTAFVAERWGRRWMTTDTSAVPIALARQRLATAIHPYYLLQDSKEGARKENELKGKAEIGPFRNDVRKGFVYERSMDLKTRDLAYGLEPATVPYVDRPIEDENKLRPSSPFCVQNANATAYLPLSDRYDDRMPNQGGGGKGLRGPGDAYAD